MSPRSSADSSLVRGASSGWRCPTSKTKSFQANSSFAGLLLTGWPRRRRRCGGALNIFHGGNILLCPIVQYDAITQFFGGGVRGDMRASVLPGYVLQLLVTFGRNLHLTKTDLDFFGFCEIL